MAPFSKLMASALLAFSTALPLPMAQAMPRANTDVSASRASDVIQVQCYGERCSRDPSRYFTRDRNPSRFEGRRDRGDRYERRWRSDRRDDDRRWRSDRRWHHERRWREGRRWHRDRWAPGIYIAPSIIAPSVVVRGGYSRHVRWCLNRYRSYSPRTDTFVGYDGYRHRCHSPYRY